MISIVLVFVAGVVVGVVHHAYLHPRLKALWLKIKSKV